MFGTPRKGPAAWAGPRRLYRLISTSTPGRRSLLISTSDSLTRRRSSMVTSGSRTVLPTVTSGVRVQFSPQSGPTQFRSHTSAALAGSERRDEPVNAATTAKARAVRISNLHEFYAPVGMVFRGLLHRLNFLTVDSANGQSHHRPLNLQIDPCSRHPTGLIGRPVDRRRRIDRWLWMNGRHCCLDCAHSYPTERFRASWSCGYGRWFALTRR
jgi:hypothetical protein